MAKRPVFLCKETFPYYEIDEVEFKFFSGFALSQKQKSINELHREFNKKCDIKVLEISTKSTELIGVKLSAFRMPVLVGDEQISLECAFQGSKKFEKGGPYIDLYKKNPWEVKKDSRLKESGAIIGFDFSGEEFGNDPKDYFYNWLYISSLYDNEEYMEQVMNYRAFSDIEFNPSRSINCQAKAASIAVGLMQAGLLDKCMTDKHIFLETVYGVDSSLTYEQMTLFS